MDDVKYMQICTWNKEMILLYGDKLTKTQRAIGWRSNGLHTAVRFTDRYGRISWHCTLADGMGGCGFKMIGYSHPYRQSRVYIPVTAEQEARLFAKACEMADISLSKADFWALTPPAIVDLTNETGCMYGPNHIKYDKWYVYFGFVTKWDIWGEHKDLMICNEAVANLFLTEWKDLLCAGKGATAIQGYDPAKLTPEQFEYLARNYFQNNAGPARTDIDNIVKEVNNE